MQYVIWCSSTSLVPVTDLMEAPARVSLRKACMHMQGAWLLLFHERWSKLCTQCTAPERLISSSRSLSDS